MKTILITGASSGIGKAIAQQLLSQGDCNLVLCGRSENKMNELLASLASQEQEKIFAKTFDLLDEKEILQFIKEGREKFGDIDILINCAGANTARACIEDLKTAELDYLIKLNTIAPFVFMRELIPAMKAKRAGMIINILSSSCLFANENIGAYTASKTGLEGLTNVLRREMRPYNVRVCALYPGGVDTPFRADKRPDYLQPETVAKAVMNAINLPDEAAIDEIVLRPFVETNFR